MGKSGRPWAVLMLFLVVWQGSYCWTSQIRTAIQNKHSTRSLPHMKTVMSRQTWKTPSNTKNSLAHSRPCEPIRSHHSSHLDRMKKNQMMMAIWEKAKQAAKITPPPLAPAPSGKVVAAAKEPLMDPPGAFELGP